MQRPAIPGTVINGTAVSARHARRIHRSHDQPFLGAVRSLHGMHESISTRTMRAVDTHDRQQERFTRASCPSLKGDGMT
jgi:hypothetical protein